MPLKMDTSLGLSSIASLSLGLSMSMSGGCGSLAFRRESAPSLPFSVRRASIAFAPAASAPSFGDAMMGKVEEEEIAEPVEPVAGKVVCNGVEGTGAEPGGAGVEPVGTGAGGVEGADDPATRQRSRRLAFKTSARRREDDDATDDHDEEAREDVTIHEDSEDAGATGHAQAQSVTASSPSCDVQRSTGEEHKPNHCFQLASLHFADVSFQLLHLRKLRSNSY